MSKEILTDELKPCPQCGALPEHIHLSCFGRMFYMYCGNCEAESDIFATKDEAVEDWNKGTARGSNRE